MELEKDRKLIRNLYLALAVPHYLLDLILKESELGHNAGSAAIMSVLFQFYIAKWVVSQYAKRKPERFHSNKSNKLVIALIIWILIFIIRVLLGLGYFFLANH